MPVTLRPVLGDAIGGFNMQVRLLCGNVNVNYVGHYDNSLKTLGPVGNEAGQQQLEKILALQPDILLLQEHTSKWIDPYCRAGWPHVADKTIRFLKDPKFDCRQVIAVQSGPDYPIDNHVCADFGFLHPDGETEHIEELVSYGRQVRSCAVAAQVELPGGERKVTVVSSHGPWVPNADAGELWPHQERYLTDFGEFLERIDRGSPIIVSCDFNARIRDVLTFLPSWLKLVTPKIGLSLELRPGHPKLAYLTERDVYVDAVLVYGCEPLEVQVVTDISDHKLHFLTVEV